MEIIIFSILTVSLAAVSVYLFILNRKMGAKCEVYLREKLEAESIGASYKNLFHIKEQELVSSKEAYENAREARFQAEKQVEITQIKIREIEKRMQDWEQSKQEAVSHAKAAIFEAGTSLSNKLLAEHKKEQEESKKQAETQINEVATKFHTMFVEVSNNVSNLNQRVKESWDSVDLVKKALLNPSGAGALAEITLENILKNSGLQEGTDFEMQYVLAGDENGVRLRPDALIFLPAGNVLIIDSKASKFFVELAMNETEDAKASLVNSMRTHLKALASKDYKEAVKDHLNKMGLKGNIKNVSTVMFLPSEMALEKVRSLDSAFMLEAIAKDILPSGPVGILSILALAKYHIAENKQVENYNHITEEIKKMLGGLANLADYAKTLGNSLKSAVNNYDKFAGSFNRNIIPKLKNLSAMGVDLPKQKQMPKDIERYQIVNMDVRDLEIEVEQTKELVE